MRKALSVKYEIKLFGTEWARHRLLLSRWIFFFNIPLMASRPGTMPTPLLARFETLFLLCLPATTLQFHCCRNVAYYERLSSKHLPQMHRFHSTFIRANITEWLVWKRKKLQGRGRGNQVYIRFISGLRYLEDACLIRDTREAYSDCIPIF